MKINYNTRTISKHHEEASVDFFFQAASAYSFGHVKARSVGNVNLGVGALPKLQTLYMISE
jgi:hypothetical protein